MKQEAFLLVTSSIFALSAPTLRHRPHGPLTGDATEPAWNGYRLTVACPCGVVFERWVTPEDAVVDLISWCGFEVSRN